MTVDPLALAQSLIRCESVTPADGGAQSLLADVLTGLGFTVHHHRFGDGSEDGPVHNFFATRGHGSPHLAFAGHTDVVPVGDRSAWSADPFGAEVRNGWLIGRGAVDMKGAIAAFVAAVSRQTDLPGTLSFIITGDEEGPATHGTDELLRWMETQGHAPDACIVGEPTSVQRLGDMMKVGRRGSLNCWITIHGAQGHVAYPARADNPVTRLIAILGDLQARVFDDAHSQFDASNLEIVDLEVGNPATNVIPAKASARLNIRFNDRQHGADLEAWLRDVVAAHAPAHDVKVRISGEAFLTEPGPLSATIAAAVKAVTGLDPEASTTGGTSDARFIRRVCPVVEFGLPGQSMHKVDEIVRVADIEALSRIYAEILRLWYR